MRAFFKKQRKWLLPLIFLALFAPFSSDLDLAIAHYFYKEGTFANHPFYAFMYRYGELVGLVIWTLAVAALMLSYLAAKYHHWRHPCLMIVLTTLIGAGIITNSCCKNFLGRPRPKQITQFGGELTYRPFWHPNLDPSRVKQKSFPSGHVAMGWSYLGFISAGRRLRFLRPIGILMTLFWGFGLMLTRVAQGGHFFSDVLISPCVMWWTVLLLETILHRFSKQASTATKQLIT